MSARLQKYRPENSDLTNSANIAALYVLSRPVPLDSALEKYRLQGFPNMTNGDYPEKFAQAVTYNKKLNADDLACIFRIVTDSRTPQEILSCFIRELIDNMKDCHRVWNEFLLFSVKDEDAKRLAFNAILDELYEMENAKKILKRIISETEKKSTAVSDFINDVERQAKEEMKEKKAPGLMHRLFGRFFGSDAEDGEN